MRSSTTRNKLPVPASERHPHQTVAVCPRQQQPSHRQRTRALSCSMEGGAKQSGQSEVSRRSKQRGPTSSISPAASSSPLLDAGLSDETGTGTSNGCTASSPRRHEATTIRHCCISNRLRAEYINAKCRRRPTSHNANATMHVSTPTMSIAPHGNGADALVVRFRPNDEMITAVVKTPSAASSLRAHNLRLARRMAEDAYTPDLVQNAVTRSEDLLSVPREPLERSKSSINGGHCQHAVSPPTRGSSPFAWRSALPSCTTRRATTHETSLQSADDAAV